MARRSANDAASAQRRERKRGVTGTASDADDKSTEPWQQTATPQQSENAETTEEALETTMMSSEPEDSSAEYVTSSPGLRMAPLLCYNNETVTQVTLQGGNGNAPVNVSTFNCPRPFEPRDHTECCGEVTAQFCCKPIDTRIYTNPEARHTDENFQKHFYWKYHFFVSKTRFLFFGIVVLVIMIFLIGMIMLIRRKRQLASSARRHIIFTVNQSDLKTTNDEKTNSGFNPIEDGIKLPEYSECVATKLDGDIKKMSSTGPDSTMASSNDPPRYSQRRGSNASF